MGCNYVFVSHHFQFSSFESWLHLPRLQQLRVPRVKLANSKYRGVTASWRIFYNHTSALCRVTDGSCLRTAAYKRETEKEKELFKKKECCKQSPHEWWCPRTIEAQLHTKAARTCLAFPACTTVCWVSRLAVLPTSYRGPVLFKCELRLLITIRNAGRTSSYPILSYFTGFLYNRNIFPERALQWLETQTDMSNEKAVKQQLLS